MDEDATTKQPGNDCPRQSVPTMTATFRSQSFVDSTYQAPLLVPPTTKSRSSTFSSSKETVATKHGLSRLMNLAPSRRAAAPSQKRAAPTGATTSSTSANTSTSAATAPLDIIRSGIPELPPMHVLGRTCTALDQDKKKLDADTLVQRIMDFLRVHSIAFTIDEPGSGRLDCTTANCLRFVIQLWRKNKTGKEQQQVFLMEVQRRQGCCIEMHEVRRRLVQQVVTGVPLRQPSFSSRRERFSCKRQRTLPPAEGRLNCEDALRISVGLIESSRVDQQELGWESLTSLTNSVYCCSKKDAQDVSRAIVCGDGSLGARLQHELETVFWKSTKMSGEDRNVSVLHHLALQALTNALEHAAPNDSSLSPDLWQTILETLLHNLEQVKQSPQEAAWSAKCLKLLLPHAVASGRLLLDASSLQSLASKALDYGKTCHLSLEQESFSLLQTITMTN